MSKPQRKFPIDFFGTLGEDPFLVADVGLEAPDAAAPDPVSRIARERVTRERVPAFPDEAPSGGSTYEPSPERRGSTRSVFFANDRASVAAPAPERQAAPEPPRPQPAAQRVVLVARTAGATEGMAALEEALADGWQVAHIAPTSSNGPNFAALVFLERA